MLYDKSVTSRSYERAHAISRRIALIRLGLFFFLVVRAAEPYGRRRKKNATDRPTGYPFSCPKTVGRLSLTSPPHPQPGSCLIISYTYTLPCPYPNGNSFVSLTAFLRRKIELKRGVYPSPSTQKKGTFSPVRVSLRFRNEPRRYIESNENKNTCIDIVEIIITALRGSGVSRRTVWVQK